MAHTEATNVASRPDLVIVDKIDLTSASNGYTEWHRVPVSRNLVSISIEKGTNFTWASAVADMQWALKATDIDDCFAVTFSPAIQFTTSANSRASIPVRGAGYIRIKTTTAESVGDPAAKVLIAFAQASIDSSQITHGTLDDISNWTDPTQNVDGKLNELASKTITAESGLVDNAIIRANGTKGKTQGSQIILDDNGALTEVKSITGSENAPISLKSKDGSSPGEVTVQPGQRTGAGDGTAVNILSGVPTDGAGGALNITAQDGVGTNKDGGPVNYTAGNKTGSGNDGAHIFDDKRVGMGVGTPKEALQVADAIALSNKTEGGTGRLVQRSTHETHTLGSGSTSDTTTLAIPSGARLLSVSMNVNTEVANGDITNRWSASFITGSTTLIVSGAAKDQNTKVPFIVPDEKTTAVTEIRFTAVSGNFSAGVIEVVVWYEEVTSLADV